jgi:hypothetical protein
LRRNDLAEHLLHAVDSTLSRIGSRRRASDGQWRPRAVRIACV